MRLPVLCALGALLITTAVAHGGPWLAPGDEGLRADIHRLADAGILRGPVTTWPMSWPDVARDALAADHSALDIATSGALARVQRLARLASGYGFLGTGVQVSAASEAASLRGFAQTPREEGELTLNAGWLTERVAINLQGTAVADPSDDKVFRPDGSYLGMNVGNFMISAGYFERWWGPGWDGSLILSTSARPIPSLTLERNYTDPFRTKWLSWLGPWRASLALGRAESHNVAIPDVRFLAARLNFKPRPWLELGLSRTAQWCGGGRRCAWDTFLDLLMGRDNQVAGDGASPDQPGNQMAGYDLRLRSPWRAVPLAFYAQLVGEDEAGGLPSKFLGLFGLETWGSTDLGGWTVRAEYADTACSFSREAPQFDCAYRNSIYPQGYAYRGRSIGHSMDNDSRLYTLAGLLTRPNGDVLSLALNRGELNRDGGAHALTGVPLDFDNVELRLSRALGGGVVTVGIGYRDPAVKPLAATRVHGFAIWQQGF